jgi:hypothetical protein
MPHFHFRQNGNTRVHTSSCGAKGVLEVLQPLYSYATHRAPPKSPLQFSTMNREEEEKNEEEEEKERWKKEEEEDEPSLNPNYRFGTAYKIVKQLCK